MPPASLSTLAVMSPGPNTARKVRKLRQRARRGGILQEAVEQVLHGHDVVTTTDGFTLRERAGCFDLSADFHSSDPPKPSGSAVHLSG